MSRISIRWRSASIVGLAAGFLLLGGVGREASPPIPHSASEAQLLRAVLWFRFAEDEARRAELVDVSTKRGTAPDQAPTLADIAGSYEELRANGLVPMRYRLLDRERMQIGESGYFLVDRRVHYERLDPRAGGLTDRVVGLLPEVTLRLPIPLYTEAYTLVVEEVAKVDEEDLETSEFLPLLEVGAFQTVSLSSQNLLANLADPTSPYELVTGDGDPSRFNIVFLGDGFTRQTSSIGFYRQEVESYADAILAAYPLSALHQALNIYRIDVVSSLQNGVEVPGVDTRDPTAPASDNCNNVPRPDLSRPNTLETHFCAKIGQTREFRYLGTTTAGAQAIASYSGLIPSFDDYVVVLANDRDFGGSGHSGEKLAFASVTSSKGGAPADCGDFSPYMCASGCPADACVSGCSSCYPPACAGNCGFEAPLFRQITWATAVHELGHAGFGLGDEYCPRTEIAGSWYCTPPGPSGTAGAYSGPEPLAPNVSKSPVPNKPAWQKLAQQSGLALPTHRVPGCPNTPAGHPLLPPPLAPDLVGAFEGATAQGTKYSCGLYRPQHECRMNFDPTVPFCPVCRAEILGGLAPHLGAGYFVLLDTVTVSDLPAHLDTTRLTYQVLGDWEPPRPRTTPSPLRSGGPIPSELLQQLEAQPVQPVPPGTRYQNQVLFRTEKLLTRLDPPESGPAPPIAVLLRVSGPGDTELAVGSCVVATTTGVHLVDGMGRGAFRCTVSVVEVTP